MPDFVSTNSKFRMVLILLSESKCSSTLLKNSYNHVSTSNYSSPHIQTYFIPPIILYSNPLGYQITIVKSIDIFHNIITMHKYKHRWNFSLNCCHQTLQQNLIHLYQNTFIIRLVELASYHYWLHGLQPYYQDSAQLRVKSHFRNIT